MTGDIFDLTGQVAFITGASSGLGRRFAEVLARRGAAVAIAARRVDRLRELESAIAAAGGKAVSVALDVTDANNIRAALDRAEQALGPVAILVNNAGITVGKPFLEHTEEDWDSVLDTNLKGPFMLGQEAARRMAAAGKGGSIINIASVLGTLVDPGVAAYCTSKSGIIQLTRSMARELARHKIRVNAIAPGWFKTDINRDYLESAPGQALLKTIPQRRFGSEEDLDGALILLASDASRYMTGTVVTVDGGILLR
jgi:3-oxoacyl-[acyl-carrier protein] reductase